MVSALWLATSDYSQRLAANLALAEHLTQVRSAPSTMLAAMVELLQAFAEIALHVAGVSTGPVATVLQPLMTAVPVIVLAERREAPIAWDALTLGSSSFAENVCSSASVGANHQF